MKRQKRNELKYPKDMNDASYLYCIDFQTTPDCVLPPVIDRRPSSEPPTRPLDQLPLASLAIHTEEFPVLTEVPYDGQ
jgi:hypothetical protein